MTDTTKTTSIRMSAIALGIAAVLFVLYPAIRPFSDETTLAGAAAFSSSAWLAAHLLAVVAFILVLIGLLGLYISLQVTAVEHFSYWALLFSIIGIGLILPFYGGETYGLFAIGQEAVRQGNDALMSLAAVVRGGIGSYLFAVGLLLLVVGAVLTAIAIWRSGIYSKWSGVPFALGLALYLPQFYFAQPVRVAHGLLVAIGCLWIAVGLWAMRKQE